eukprot:Selendium_serpulae@DN7952_c0_g1_i1.p1
MSESEPSVVKPTEVTPANPDYEKTYKDMTPQQLTLQRNKLQQTKLALVNKINDLESDRREHKVVLEAFEGVPEDRRCFRMVGGVMVERTVKEVRPVLEQHEMAVGKAIEALEKELDARIKENAFLAARLQPEQTA